jgi:hypothetical protein
MSRHQTIVVTGALLAAVLFAFPALGRDHNFLNGTWTLAPAQSDFAGQRVLQSGTVTIDERQGNITVSRSFVYEGDAQTVFYSDSTDSANDATIRSGKEIKSKTRWDHDVLRVTTTESGATTVESYSLTPDGTMTCTVVRPEHKPITLVFQRK